MPEIPDKCEFDVQSDKVKFETQTNGDHIAIDVNLSQDNAAALAWLVNDPNPVARPHSVQLEVKIKLKT